MVLALLGIGCRESRSPSPTHTTAVPGITSSASVFPCPHPYYPLRQGFAINYESSGGPRPGPSHLEVIAVSSTGALVRTTLDTFTGSQYVRCAPDGGLTGQGSVDFLAARLRGVEATIESSEGDLLPRTLATGVEWTSTMNIHLRFSDNPAMASAGLGDIRGRITLQHKAISAEEVRVAAGRFDALKIQTTMHTTLDLPGGRASVNPLGEDAHTDEWWVRDTGVVKTTIPIGGGVVIETQATAIFRP